MVLSQCWFIRTTSVPFPPSPLYLSWSSAKLLCTQFVPCTKGKCLRNPSRSVWQGHSAWEKDYFTTARADLTSSYQCPFSFPLLSFIYTLILLYCNVPQWSNAPTWTFSPVFFPSFASYLQFSASRFLKMHFLFLPSLCWFLKGSEWVTFNHFNR